MSFEGSAHMCFALFVDGRLRWIAEIPQLGIGPLKRAAQTRAEVETVIQWLLTYQGPTLDPERVFDECRAAEEDWQQRPREDIPTLKPMGPLLRRSAAKAELKHQRFVAAMKELDPTRIRIGMGMDQVRAMLPAPSAVDQTEGATRYSYGGDFDGGWYPAPRLIVIERDGRVAEVTTLYATAEYMKRRR